MIDTTLRWTGIVTWVIIITYLFPLIPVIVLAWTDHLLQRVGDWWSNTYLQNEQNSRERYEEYAELREEDYWKTRVTVGILRARRGVEKMCDLYEKIAGIFYSRLPFVS